MAKTLKTINNLDIEPDVISIFASGPSVLNIPKNDLLKIYQESYCIWFNFAPVKFNKYIDCLFWMDWKVSIWLDKFYQDTEKEIPVLWTRDMAFYEHRELEFVKKVDYWFDGESDYLESTNLSLVICLLELTRYFPDKKILLFGLDLKGPKWYTEFLKPGEDNWKHKEDLKVDLSDCFRDLLLVENKNVFNCTPDSPCEYFKKVNWKNILKYNNTLRLKGPSGLGDAVYSYPIVKHYIDAGFDVEVLTKYPEIYQGLKFRKRPFFYFNYDIDFSYVDRKFHWLTNQFQDMCKLAGIRKKIPMEMDFYSKRNFPTKKKICIVQRPYWPMNELEKRFELVPYYPRMQEFIDRHPEYYYVMIGVKNNMDIKFKGINQVIQDTTTLELLEIINSSDMIITQIGWTIAMAEVLNKKVFVFFSARGLKSKNWFFSTITPRKVITKKSSGYCLDDWSNKKIERRFNKLCLL